jgi:signal transduction histidine kinase
VDVSFTGEPLLFDNRRARVLTIRGSKRCLWGNSRAIESSFLVQYRIEAGLLIRVAAGDYAAEVFVIGVRGLCSDDLSRGHRVGEEITAAFRQAAALDASEDAAATRARLALARDLHDTAVQSLAGAALRVTGVRKSLAAGRDVDAELLAVEQVLVQEQRELRKTIAIMRGGKGLLRLSNLPESCADLLQRIARQWNITCSIESMSRSIEVPAVFEREVHQLLKEAVSNAVRHGKATNVSVSLGLDDENITIEISDNGIGFPIVIDQEEVAVEGTSNPWSLNERVHQLGGTLALISSGNGSRLFTTLPMPYPGVKGAL